jgi:hypothetical protein
MMFSITSKRNRFRLALSILSIPFVTKGMNDNSSWSLFDSYREMKVEAGGKILVIRPADTTTVVPLFCPVCKFSMQNSDDSIAYRKKQCCDKCLLHCKGNKDEMPPEQWEEYLRERQNSSKHLFNLK